VYGPDASIADMLKDCVAPVVAAILEGVSALLLVSGNHSQLRRFMFDGLPGAPVAPGLLPPPGPTAQPDAGAPPVSSLATVETSIRLLFSELEAKRASFGAAGRRLSKQPCEWRGGCLPLLLAAPACCCRRSSYVSYLALDDAVLFDIFDDSPRGAAPRGAGGRRRRPLRCRCAPRCCCPAAGGLPPPPPPRARPLQGLTTFGPVSAVEGALELLRTGSANFGDLARLHAEHESAGGPGEGALRARPAASAGLSRIIRLTVTQVWGGVRRGSACEGGMRLTPHPPTRSSPSPSLGPCRERAQVALVPRRLCCARGSGAHGSRRCVPIVCVWGRSLLTPPPPSPQATSRLAAAAADARALRAFASHVAARAADSARGTPFDPERAGASASCPLTAAAAGRRRTSRHSSLGHRCWRRCAGGRGAHL